MKQRTHGQGMLAVMLSAVMVLSGVAPAFAQEAPAREETAFEAARETAETLPAGETSQAQPESGLQPENDPRPDAILIPDPVSQMPEEADDPEKEEAEPGFGQEEPEPVGTVELNGTALMGSEFKIYKFETGDPTQDSQVTDGILDLSKKYYATSSYTAWKQHYSLCMIPEGTEITPELVPVTKKDSMTPYPDGLMEIYCGRNHYDGGVIYYSNTSNYTNGVVGDGFRLEYLRGHGYTRPKAGGGVESPQYTQVLPGTYRFLIYNDSTVYYSAPYTVTDTEGLSSVLGTVNAKFYDVKNADGTYGVRDSRLKGNRDSLTWLSSRSSKFYLDLSGFTQQLGRPLNSKTDSIHLAYGFLDEEYDSSDVWGTWTTIWPLNSARAGESSEAKYPTLVDDSENNRQVIEGIELKTRDQGCPYTPMYDGYSYRVVVVLDEYKENNRVYIDNKTFQFIDQADGIRIKTSVLPPARLDEPYEAEFEAIPMKEGAKITWSLLDKNEDGTDSRIPEGLVFDGSGTDTAFLTGTPSSVENTRFTIQAEEEGGKKHKREYSITFRNEIVVYVTGLGEKEAASLYCRPDAEAPEGRSYIGTVRNGRNYFDTSLMRALKGQYFFIDRNAAFGIVSDGMVQLTGEDRSLNINASPMKGYSLVFQDEEGKSLPGGILASLKVKDGNYCAAGNDGIYRVPEGQSINSLDLIATLDTRDPDLVREYKLEGNGNDGCFPASVDTAGGTITVIVPKRRGGLRLTGRVYAKAGDKEFPVTGAVLTVKQKLPGRGESITRTGLSRTSGNEAFYTVQDLYEGLTTTICIYASGYGTKTLYSSGGTDFSVSDGDGKVTQYDFGNTDQTGGDIELGEYVGNTSVTLFVKGISKLHTVSGLNGSSGYSYSIADLLSPSEIYVGIERGVVRRLGSVSVNKDGGGHIIGFTGLSDAEKAVFPDSGKLYEAYEVEGLPADKVKLDSRLKVYDDFGNLIGASSEGLSIVSLNTGKYAEAEVTGFGILDASDVLSPENFAVAVYNGSGEHVRGMVQTTRQTLLPAGTYTVLLCPSCYSAPYSLTGWEMDEESGVQKLENVVITSGSVTSVDAQLRPSESSSYAILNAPEKAAAGEVYEVRGMIHPGANGLKCLRVSAPGMCQFILDGKTMKGRVYTGSFYCMDYEELNLTEDVPVRISIRMPEANVRDGSNNTVYIESWETQNYRTRTWNLGRVSTEKAGGLSLHIPARADMDIETGRAEIRYTGHSSAGGGRPVYLYDNDVPAGSAFTDNYGDFSGVLALATGGLFHTIRASYVFSEAGADRSYDPNDVECQLLCQAGQAILTGIRMHCRTGGISEDVDMAPGQAQKKYTVRGEMEASYSATVKNVSAYPSPRTDEADPLPAGSVRKVSETDFSGLKRFRTFVKGDKVRWKEADENYDTEKHEVTIGTEGVAFFKVRTTDGSFTVPAETCRVNEDGTVTFFSGEIPQGNSFTNGVSLLFEAGSDEGYWGSGYYSPAAILRNEDGTPVDESGNPVVNENGELLPGKEFSVIENGTTNYDLLTIRNLAPLTVSRADADAYKAVKYNTGSENYISEEDVSYGQDSEGKRIPVEIGGSSAENLKRLNMAGLSDNSLVENLSFDTTPKEEPESTGSGPDSIEAAGAADSLMDAVSYEKFMGYKNTNSWSVKEAPAQKPTTLKGIIEERNRQLLENLIAMKDTIENDSELKQNVDRFGMVDEDNARKVNEKDYSLVTLVDYASAVDEGMMDKMGYRETVYEYKTKDEDGNPTSDTLVMKVYTATTFYKKNGEIIADPSLQSYETAAATLDTYIFYNPEVAEAAENPTITADLHPFKWTRIQLASMIPGANCPIYTGGFVAPLATWTPTSYTPISSTGSAGITATGDTSVNGNDVEAAGGTKFKPVENTKIGFFGTGFRFDLNPKNWSDGTKIAGAGLALSYFNKFRNAALKRAQDAAKNGKEIKNLEFMDGKGSYSMADDTIRIGKYEKVPGTEKWTIKDLKWYGNETYQYYTKVEWETAYKSIMNVKVSDIVNGGSAGFSALSMYKSYQPSNPPTYKEMMNDTRQQLRDALRWVSKNEELKKNMDEDAYQALMQSIVDRMNVLTEVEKDAECADHQNEFTGGAGVKVIDGINFVSGLIPDPTGICETINLTSGTISFVLNAANDNAQAHRLERIQDYGVKHDMFMTMLMSYGYPPKKDDKKGGGSGSDPEQPDEVDPGTPESGGGNPPSDTSCVQVQDPSGTVYEAVLSNPVEGATVRLYTADAKAEGGDSWKPEYEKDASGTWVYYDEDSGRPKEPKNVPSINGVVERKIPGPQLILPENPVQLTGEDGRFQWDVTEGLWYVEAEKPGYNLDNEGTAQPSDSGGDTASTVSRDGISWMPVLPAQLEVNLPMVDKTAPFVIDDEEDTENIDNIRMQSDGVYITFSKYMEEESLGISEDAAVSAAETPGLRTVSCGMVPTHYVIYDSDGEEIPYTLFLLNSEQAPGNRAGDYAGEAPWYTSKLLLQFTEDREEETGEELSVRLICGGGHFVSYAGTPMAQDYVATRTTVPKHRTEEPVFDPPSGTVFTKDGDNHVTITCATEGAVIYYTTDGSEPLSGLLPGATAKRYGEPVLITEDVTIRAAARRLGYFDSLTAEASYTVKQDGGGGGGGGGDDDEEPVSDDFWLTGFRKKLSYTGKKLTQPDISLHFGDVTLISGRDYRVTYLNNLNAGTAKMILKGVGNYDMTLEYPFEILPVSIAGAEFDSPDISVKKPKSGNARRPKIVLKWGSRTLRQGSERDYTVDDSSVDYGKAGTYTIRLKGVKNFTGEYPVEYILTGDVLMSAVRISGLKAQDWTGEPVILRPSSSAVPGKGEFTVKYGGKVITKGFTVSFNHNTDAGTARLILKGTGEDCGDGKGTKLAGTKAVTFKIKGRPIRKALVDALPTDAVYDGNPHTPAAKLTWGGTALKEGTDYTVSYSKNINAGKASVSYKGMGGYTGTLKKTFKIAKRDLADTSGLITVSVGAAPYEKGGAKPEVRLFLSGNELIAGQDFALKYKDNKAAGRTGTVTILGKKNFKGRISRNFEVTVRSLSCLNLVVPDVVWRDKKENYRTKPVLYDLNGKKLAVNKDYEGTFTYRKSSASGNEGALLEKADQTEKGTWLMVSLTAKGGNYTGTVSGVFRVVEKSISSVRFVIPDQIYIPGGSAELSQSEIDRITSTPAGVKTEVVPGSYKNNTKAGKASVTLHGLGSYGGTKTVTFRVRRRTKKGYY